MRILQIVLMLLTMSAFAALYKIEPTHTYAYFKVNHLERGWLTGVFKDVDGKFSLDGEKKFVDLTIHTKSLDTFNKKRDEHLLSPDFFNARRHRAITFKSTRVIKTSGNTYRVEGDLTMLGTTKSVVAEVARGKTGLDFKKLNRTGGNATFTIKRSEFGMNKMVGAISDEVKIDFYFEGIL